MTLMESIAKTTTPDSKLHFLDYWRVIRIRKSVIMLVFLLVVVTTTAVTFLLKETYASTVRIAVAKDISDIAPLSGMQSFVPFDPYFIETEFQKIQSKRVLHAVIKELDLERKFSEEMKLNRVLRLSETFMILLKRIDVRQSRNTSLIEIKVYDPDQEQAAIIANAIARVYREWRTGDSSEQSIAGIEILRNKLKDHKLEVAKVQQQVDAERQKHLITDSMFVDGRNYIGLEPETLRRIEAQRITSAAEVVQISSLLAALNEKKGEDLIRTVHVVAPDSLLPVLLEQRALNQQRLASIQHDLGVSHPDVIRLRQLEGKIKDQIDDSVDGIMQGLAVKVAYQEAHRDTLMELVEAAKKKDVATAEKVRFYLDAKRRLEALKRIEEAILLRALQEEVDSALPKESVVQVVDHAEASLRPVRPNVPLNIALGIVVGLVLGIGLAFFIEYLDTSVKTIDDVERALSTPVLGVIPQNVGALIEEGPDSPHAEAYRVLRTNVLFSRKEDTSRALTVVSGGAGEGKSTTIFNLATVFAQQGTRVLVVDSDLRRPSLHKILNVSNTSGLTNVLMKQNTIEEVIQTTQLPNMDFMASGKLPSSSMGVLNSIQMKEFIKEVKRRYDFVFFDSPPIMGVSDASILASEVDMSLLVVQYRKYPQAMTVRAKQMVEKVGGNLLGVVLNNINISPDREAGDRDS